MSNRRFGHLIDNPNEPVGDARMNRRSRVNQVRGFGLGVLASGSARPCLPLRWCECGANEPVFAVRVGGAVVREPSSQFKLDRTRTEVGAHGRSGAVRGSERPCPIAGPHAGQDGGARSALRPALRRGQRRPCPGSHPAIRIRLRESCEAALSRLARSGKASAMSRIGLATSPGTAVLPTCSIATGRLPRIPRSRASVRPIRLLPTCVMGTKNGLRSLQTEAVLAAAPTTRHPLRSCLAFGAPSVNTRPPHLRGVAGHQCPRPRRRGCGRATGTSCRRGVSPMSSRFDTSRTSPRRRRNATATSCRTPCRSGSTRRRRVASSHTTGAALGRPQEQLVVDGLS